MNFEVDDFESTVKKFTSYGAHKDGDIIENDDYKVNLIILMVNGIFYKFNM